MVFWVQRRKYCTVTFLHVLTIFQGNIVWHLDKPSFFSSFWFCGFVCGSVDSYDMIHLKYKTLNTKIVLSSRIYLGDTDGSNVLT